MQTFLALRTRLGTPARREDLAILAFGILFAAVLRYVLRGCVNADLYYPGLPSTGMSGQTTTWYKFISERGFLGFSELFSDYTPPYLYALYLISVLDRAFLSIDPIVAVKLPSMLMDFVLALYVSRIVRLLHPQSPVPLFSFLVTLYWPTVVLNSAVWGQMDVLYAAPLVASLYYFLQGQQHRAWIAFGVAFTVKLQSVFLVPFLLALLVRRQARWRHVLYVPLVYFVMVLPFWAAGRPLGDLATIYLMQATLYDSLTMDAPNLYVWLPVPAEQARAVAAAGIVLGLAGTVALAGFIRRSGVVISQRAVILLAFASVLILPFLLPRMHQRYFFAADVFAILWAFSDRRNVPAAIAVTLVSAFAYTRFLFGAEVFPLQVLAAVMLLVIVVVCRQLIDVFYPRPVLHLPPVAST